MTLPGQFRLPVSLRVETYEIRESTSAKLTGAEASALLEAFAARYLPRQMIAGRIQQTRQTILGNGDIYRLRGGYLCQEMLGREKREGNGESNGKTSGQSGERGAG